MSNHAASATGLDIAVEDAGVRFSTPGATVEALSGCSVEVEAGSFTVVIGPNGSGKSTLLRLMAGLIQPSSGTVRVGADRPRAGDGRVGLAFQQPRLVPWRDALDNVALPLELAGLAAAERRSRAHAALERVGLATVADRRPAELSGGMAQRVGLARALATDPPVLLLDEPFSALDALTRETFDTELQHLWLERRRTIVLVTHSVAEAVILADRVAVMTARPGSVARIVEIDLPRPRPPDLMGERHAAELAAEIRKSLASAHALELRAWTEQEGAA